MYIEEKGFKESINLCLDIEKQWLTTQSLLALELEEHTSILLLSSVSTLRQKMCRCKYWLDFRSLLGQTC